MIELTLAEVLDAFLEDTKELDVSAIKVKRQDETINLVADLGLSEDEQRLFAECFKVVQEKLNDDERRKLQDRLYQHLGRHPKFGEKENGMWVIPQENLTQIAHWAVKVSPTEEGEKKIARSVMLKKSTIGLLDRLQKGQKSTIIEFSITLFFSIVYGYDTDIVADKLRLYAKLTGAQDVDKRLMQLIGE